MPWEEQPDPATRMKWIVKKEEEEEEGEYKYGGMNNTSS